MQNIFTSVGALQAVAEMYQNDTYIADRVFPRVRTSTTNYRFKRWAAGSRFTIPQTLTGRLSPPRRVQDRWIEDTGLVKDYGLDHPIAMQDFRDAGANGVDMRLNATTYLTQLVRLDREVRVATLLFDSDSYDAALVDTLGAGEQFDDPDSNPIWIILNALTQPLVRPNLIVFGVDAWNYFRTHPKVVQAIRGAISPGNNAATEGIVNETDVAALFRVQEVLIGDARINTASAGLTPVLARVFNDSVALIYRNTSVTSTFDQIVTFGYTVEYETIIAGVIPDADMGLHGGFRVRVGESVQEQLVASQAGYLLLDCVSD